MKILVDSSTLYSAIAHGGRVSELMDILIERFNLVITDHIVEEIKRNLSKKLSEKNLKKALYHLEIFLSNCEIKQKGSYIKHLSKALKMISKKDSPVLACGMLPDIDYLLTSDKEFWDVESDKVTIISPKEARDKLL